MNPPIVYPHPSPSNIRRSRKEAKANSKMNILHNVFIIICVYKVKDKIGVTGW
jgi:hypothetical protein